MAAYNNKLLGMLPISKSSSPSRSRSRSRSSHERTTPTPFLAGKARKRVERIWPCMLCMKDHRLATCVKYTSLSTHERLDFVRRMRYCINCLAISHNSRNCKSPKVCNVCRKRHHSSLHHLTPPEPVLINIPRVDNDCEDLPMNPPPPSPPIVRKHVVIPTVRLALIYSGVRRIVRALINPSQPFTTISETIVKQCRLMTRTIDHKSMCMIQIGNIQNSKWMEEVHALVTDGLPLRPYPCDLKISAPFDTLILADPDFYISDEVHIVLAADIYPKIIADGIVSHESGEVVAQDTIFGWTLTGSVQG